MFHVLMIIFWLKNADQSFEICLELSQELTYTREVLLFFQTSSILTIYSTGYKPGSCEWAYNVECPTNCNDDKLQRLIAFAQFFVPVDIRKIKLWSWWISLWPPYVWTGTVARLLQWFGLALRYQLQSIILHRVPKFTCIFRLFIAKLLLTRFAALFTTGIHLVQASFNIGHTKFGLFIMSSWRVLEIFDVVFLHRTLCFIIQHFWRWLCRI